MDTRVDPVPCPKDPVFVADGPQEPEGTGSSIVRNEYQLPSNDKRYRQKIFALESYVLRLITAMVLNSTSMITRRQKKNSNSDIL